MAANSGTLHDYRVRVLQPDEVATVLAPAFGATLLSELTHLPTGIASSREAPVELAPGARSGPHHHGPVESLMLVLSGRVVVRWGKRLEHSTVAGPGEFVLVAPWTPHEECNDKAAGALRYRQLGDDLAHIPLDSGHRTPC